MDNLEALAAELEAFCEKHNLNTGLIAVPQEDHFIIITCNMTPGVMKLLGQTILQCTPPSDHKPN